MTRKSKISLLALAAILAPGFASAGQTVQVRELADAAGLSVRNVRMLLGPARTPYAEYRYTFHKVERQFIAAVGAERYHDLLAGKPVRFERLVDGRRVVFIVQLEPTT